MQKVKWKALSTVELNALVREKARHHGLRVTERERDWNALINELDRLEPNWRGYPVPQTTGANWRVDNGRAA